MYIDSIVRFVLEYIDHANGYVFARQIDDGGFVLSDDSTLGGRPLKPIITQPRALDREGEPRTDLWGFYPRSQSTLDDWSVGAVVSLTHSNMPETTVFD